MPAVGLALDREQSGEISPTLRMGQDNDLMSSVDNAEDYPKMPMRLFGGGKANSDDLAIVLCVKNDFQQEEPLL